MPFPVLIFGLVAACSPRRILGRSGSMLTLLCGVMLCVVSCSQTDAETEIHGVFEAQEITVSAQASGQLQDFVLEEGQQVVAHAPLGLIDTTFLSYQYDQISKQKETSTSAGITNSQVQTQAIREQIQALETEKARFQRLVKERVVAQKVVDEIQAKIEVAQAQLQAATSAIGQKNASSLGAASVMDSQANQIRKMIERSIVVSPISGTVLAVYLHNGELAGMGRPIFRVANLETMTLRAYATAEQLQYIRLGDRLTVYSDLGETNPQAYEGVVTWISSKAEFTPKNIQTADERAALIYALKIAVKNDGKLRIGQYGKAEIPFPKE